MPEKLWKAVERKLCKILGGIRRGPTGRDESDCCHDWLSIEIKCNRKMPAYIREWMAQTWCNAEPGKLPIVVWHQVGDPYSHALVSMRLSSFLDWFGDSEEPLPFTDLAQEGDEDEGTPPSHKDCVELARDSISVRTGRVTND